MPSSYCCWVFLLMEEKMATEDEAGVIVVPLGGIFIYLGIALVILTFWR